MRNNDKSGVKFFNLIDQKVFENLKNRIRLINLNSIIFFFRDKSIKIFIESIESQWKYKHIAIDILKIALGSIKDFLNIFEIILNIMS